ELSHTVTINADLTVRSFIRRPGCFCSAFKEGRGLLKAIRKYIEKSRYMTERHNPDNSIIQTTYQETMDVENMINLNEE
ncbi:unnamed protein product, partial [Rotaria magnacalcarata]